MDNLSSSVWWNEVGGSSKLSKTASAILSLPSLSAVTHSYKKKGISYYTFIRTKTIYIKNRLKNQFLKH